MKKYLIITILVLFALVCGLSYSLTKTVQERQRLDSNQRSLLSDVKYYRTRDSLSAASVERLELPKKELEEHESDLVAEIEDLNIKIRRMVAASTTGTETKTEVKTIVKDSLIYLDGKIDTVSCIDFSDPWVSLNGCVFGNEFRGLITSKDTLIQVVHRVPREWVIFKWGTKGLRQEITSKNPHTEITYSEYIELKKR